MKSVLTALRALKAVIAALQGKKSNLLALAASVLTLLQSSGLIHLAPATLQAILTLLGAGAIASLHAAIVNATPAPTPAGPPSS